MPLTFAAIQSADRLTPLGVEQVTAGLAAAQNLPNIPTGAQVAIIQAEGGAIRYRDDGTAPTAAIGVIIASGDSAQYPGDLARFQFIGDGGGAATAVNIAYYRYGA